MIFDRFFPDIYVKDIYSIDYAKLKNEGIETIVFDLDNTLAPFDIDLPTKEIDEILKKLSGMGFTVLIVSNNASSRVEKFCESLDVRFIGKAGKPKIKKINDFIKQNGGLPEKSAIVGDQLFTDMWVGTKLGLRKILVEPIANRDEFTVKLKRGLEKAVFRIYLSKEHL